MSEVVLMTLWSGKEMKCCRCPLPMMPSWWEYPPKACPSRRKPESGCAFICIKPKLQLEENQILVMVIYLHERRFSNCAFVHGRTSAENMLIHKIMLDAIVWVKCRSQWIQCIENRWYHRMHCMMKSNGE